MVRLLILKRFNAHVAVAVLAPTCYLLAAYPAWETLGADVTATNTRAAKLDSMPSGVRQRFYRVLWVD